MKVNSILSTDLENYQEHRLEQGRSNATVDMETRLAQTMVTKAFDNDKIGSKPLKVFRKTKKKLKKGSNPRR